LRGTLRNWTDRARLASSGFATKYLKRQIVKKKTEKNYLQIVRMSTKAFGIYQLYFSYNVKATLYAAIGGALRP
jgi:hypothetical protein